MYNVHVYTFVHVQYVCIINCMHTYGVCRLPNMVSFLNEGKPPWKLDTLVTYM